MNDLSYKVWMRFQKSFFRFVSTQSLMEECVYFFTKRVWPDGTPSRSLIIGFSDFNADAIPAPRVLDVSVRVESLASVVDILRAAVSDGRKYDFALIDLRPHIQDEASVIDFLDHHSCHMFRALRTLLVRDRYCGVVVGMGEAGGGTGFPLAWTVALECRRYLRLRDEKVALVESEGQVFYCLFMQAQDDKRPAHALSPQSLYVAKRCPRIPAWTIPKPPPRKPNEILHPAKFPETLVTQFIELFTTPGQRVLDPMVGTGSTVVAALQTGRHGYGVDLIPEFVRIANGRVARVKDRTLIDRELASLRATVVQGDATRLNEVAELNGVDFHYVITSPPYWSMLTNRGSEYQRGRRRRGLRLVYSHDERDLGNEPDYDRFLDLLVNVYSQVAAKLVGGGYLTVVVKNVKRKHVVYPLAWDLVRGLCGHNGDYEYVGATLWCQDDVPLKPFAVGTHWVSNTLHHYCLHMRKRSNS